MDDSATVQTAQRTSVEVVVGEIWARALGLKSVGVHERYADLGGDSLSALRIATEIWERFGVEVPPSLDFRQMTVAKLTNYLINPENSEASR